MTLARKACLLSTLVLLLLQFASLPAYSRALLGISCTGVAEAPLPAAADLAPRLEEASGNLLTVHNYNDQASLLGMLTRFGKLDAVLIPRDVFDRQPAASLEILAEAQLSGDTRHRALVLAARPGLDKSVRDQLIEGYRELLFSMDGLGLLEACAATFSAPAAIIDGLAGLDTAAGPVTAAPPTPQPAPAASGQPYVATPQAEPPPSPYGAHADLKGRLGNGRALGEIDMFIPLAGDRDRLFFLDLRAQLDDDSAREGNLGLGFRSRVGDDLIFGGYGFYDLRRSGRGNAFRQVTLGAEALAESWDGRVNLYLPDDREYLVASVAPLDRIVYSGNLLLHQTGGTAFETREKPMHGYDAELGWRLPWFTGREVRGYLGGYHFSASGTPDMTGPRARLEVRFPEAFSWRGSLLELGGELSHDRVRDTDYALTLRARFPFGAPEGGPATAHPGLQARMTERIQRDPDILVALQHRDSSTPVSNATLTTAGDPITFTHVDSNAGDGDGTFELPVNSLTAAGATGSSIVLLYADSTFTGEGISLAAGQRLLGEPAGHRIDTDQFGLIDLPRASAGTAAPLIGSAATAVELADGSEVSGIAIADSATAIYGSSVGGVRINRVTISNAEDGILLDGLTPHARTTVIADNVLDTIGFDGIALYNDDATGSVAAAITGNRLLNLGVAGFYGAGIYVENNGLDLRVGIAGNSVDTAYDEGILVVNAPGGTALTLNLIDNLVERAGLDGIAIENSGATTGLYLGGNRADGNTADGYADYYLVNPGTLLNLGASAGSPVIGSSFTDSDGGVIADEDNARADGTPADIQLYGPVDIVERAGITTPWE